MFVYRTPLRLADTDAAGVLFFARQFDLMHEAYEAFMREIGFGLDRLLRDEPYFISIVRAESDYRAPVRYGDELQITVTVRQIGQSSYVIGYAIEVRGAPVGSGQTVHVCIERQTKSKRALPDELQRRLERHRDAHQA